MIIVCSLKDLPAVCESVKPIYLISVIDPGYAPDTPKTVLKHLKLGFDDIVSISDEGPLYRVPGKNSHIKQTLFNEKNALTKEFYGGKFACVRDEFRIWTNNVLRKNVKKILVSFGGTDPTQITTKIFKVIENLSLKNIEFIIILGFGFEHKEEIKKSATQLKKNGFVIKLVEKSDFLAKYIRYADFAIVSNGRTVFEVASMQVPILSVAVNDREKSHTFVRDENVGRHIDYNSLLFTKELASSIEYLLEYKNRKKFKSKLKKLELLCGVDRVVNIIDNEFKLRT